MCGAIASHGSSAARPSFAFWPILCFVLLFYTAHRCVASSSSVAAIGVCALAASWPDSVGNKLGWRVLPKPIGDLTVGDLISGIDIASHCNHLACWSEASLVVVSSHPTILAIPHINTKINPIMRLDRITPRVHRIRTFPILCTGAADSGGRADWVDPYFAGRVPVQAAVWGEMWDDV